MTRIKAWLPSFLLVLTVLLVFVAGTLLGVLIVKLGHPPRPRSWLVTELNLTRDQQDQMQKIWSETMESAFRQQEERRAALAKERDQAIAALLSADQRSKYEAVRQDYARKMEELSADRKRAFDEAVARTKRILTPRQAAKYDELMSRQREHGREGGPPPPEFRGPRHHPASGPMMTEEPPAPHGGE
jgi:Spy/CpxP family protein refolding chaperone